MFRIQFHEWCEKYKISDREKDFISTFVMNYSAATSGHKPELVPKFMQMLNDTFPEYTVSIAPEELNYNEFDKIMHEMVKVDFDSAELLFSFYVQGLGAPLAKYLLSTGETETSKHYYNLILSKPREE